MSLLRDEEMKVRVPARVKACFKLLADTRLTSESELAREALFQYLAKNGITIEMLRDVPVGQAVDVTGATGHVSRMMFAETADGKVEVVVPPKLPVSYSAAPAKSPPGRAERAAARHAQRKSKS